MKLLSAIGCTLTVLSLSSLLPAQTRPLPAGVYSVRLQVLDEKGGPVQDVQIRLVGIDEAGGKRNMAPHRKVQGQEPRDLRPKDFVDGFARLDELPAGRFAVLVDSPLAARTLSKPFTIPSRTEATVVVRLLHGGTLTGTVVGPDQKPVAGATVRTDNPRMSNGEPLGQLLANLVLDTQTTTSTTSGPDGTFRLDHLAPGRYRVVVEHPGFVPNQIATEVKDDDQRQLAPIALADGVLVTGLVRRGTAAVPGADVVFLFEDVAPTSAEAMHVRSYRVQADGEGRFRLPVRVPPKKGYVLMAAQPGSPFEQSAEFAASRLRFDVPAGKPEHAELLLIRTR